VIPLPLLIRRNLERRGKRTSVQRFDLVFWSVWGAVMLAVLWFAWLAS
jgi:hypothetical protein